MRTETNHIIRAKSHDTISFYFCLKNFGTVHIIVFVACGPSRISTYLSNHDIHPYCLHICSYAIKYTCRHHDVHHCLLIPYALMAWVTTHHTCTSQWFNQTSHTHKSTSTYAKHLVDRSHEPPTSVTSRIIAQSISSPAHKLKEQIHIHA